MKDRLYLSGAILLAGAAGALAVVYTSEPADPFAPCREDTMIDFSQIGGPFELIDETGQDVTDADVFTRPTLFYLGYTFCPDVCPLDNMRNADAVYLMEEAGTEVQSVFLSIDPQRDAPEVLAEFTEFFHPQMIGLTGTLESVRAVADAYASFFEVQETGDEFYLIDHSTHTFLVLPEHGVVDIINREEMPEEVATRAACMIEHA